jgi:hypothetical protein
MARKELVQIEVERPSHEQSDVDEPAAVSKRAKSGSEQNRHDPTVV